MGHANTAQRPTSLLPMLYVTDEGQLIPASSAAITGKVRQIVSPWSARVPSTIMQAEVAYMYMKYS